MCELLHTSPRGTGISGRSLIRLLLPCFFKHMDKLPPAAEQAWQIVVELRLTVMEISIHSLLEGARRATGTVAVIDVFRAFTTAAVALANGASGIVMVRTGQRGTGASASRDRRDLLRPEGETGYSVAKHG
jgi:hypothetical protein